MLLTVLQIMKKKKSDAGLNLVLAYAITTATALSLSNPFDRQLENHLTDKTDKEQYGDSVDNKLLDKEEKSRRKKLKEAARASRERFSNPSSNALSVAHALQCYERSECPSEFCDENFLHAMTMEVVSKLRKQLFSIVFSHGSDNDDPGQDFSWAFRTVNEVEQSWNVSYKRNPLTIY